MYVKPWVSSRLDPICQFIFIGFSLTISIFASHKTTLPIHDKCHHVAVCKRQNKRPSGPEQLAAVYTYTKENPKKNKEAGYGCLSYLCFPWDYNFQESSDRKYAPQPGPSLCILKENLISLKWQDPAEWHLAHVCLPLEVHRGGLDVTKLLFWPEKGFLLLDAQKLPLVLLSFQSLRFNPSHRLNRVEGI